MFGPDGTDPAVHPPGCNHDTGSAGHLEWTSSLLPGWATTYATVLQLLRGAPCRNSARGNPESPLTDVLAPGGTILLAECGQRWPATTIGERQPHPDQLASLLVVNAPVVGQRFD
jgi:hypothetical protein